MKLLKILNESIKNKIYYHGTSLEKNGKDILKLGIKPGRIITSNKAGAPVANRVYLTPHIEYAVIYCTGGVYMGSNIDDLILRDGRYGYLFSISIDKLTNDIQPDEDVVGYLLQYVFTGNYYDDSIKNIDQFNFNWLKNLAEIYLTNNQIYKIYHNYDDFQLYKMGKKIIKYMSNDQKKQIVDAGSHIAYEGNIKPDHAWKFDKLLNIKLKKDGSNFFQLAKKIY